MTKPPDSLVHQWRTHAQTLRKYGAESQALAVESCAEELKLWLRECLTEALTLQEAARESGYSADHLGRLVRDGKVPNAGRANAPRIRRCDLPMKREDLRDELSASQFAGTSKEQIARSIVAYGGLR